MILNINIRRLAWCDLVNFGPKLKNTKNKTQVNENNGKSGDNNAEFGISHVRMGLNRTLDTYK